MATTRQAELGKGRVGVFLCGLTSVKQEIRQQCAMLNKEQSTTFCFHAELF